MIIYKKTSAVGKWLMKNNKIKIIILDDQDVYFNPKMIAAAEAAGYFGIQRVRFIDADDLIKIYASPPDIFITDIRGVCSSDVARDGMELARTLLRNTKSMVVLTSAHKFHLSNIQIAVHHVIENRHLTAVDFVDELSLIIDKFLTSQLKIYKKIGFRIGWSLVKLSIKKGWPS